MRPATVLASLVLFQVLYPGAPNRALAPQGCDGTNYIKGDGTCGTPAAGGLPAGAIILVASGTCPNGFTEVAGLDGKFLLGTIAAHGDIGGTGGQDTVTAVINHTHPVNVNDPGHVHPEGYRNTGTAGTAGVQGASTANNASIAGGALSATTGITATTSNPAGGVASIDNRPAFVKVIFCQAS